jgi:photosynthetic reaction center H subunit
MWVDVPEQLVRYLTMDVNPDGDGNTRLIPMNFAKIGTNHIKVRSLHAHNIAGIPSTKSNSEITLLEEEKITAYFGGGTLYATPERAEPRI